MKVIRCRFCFAPENTKTTTRNVLRIVSIKQFGHFLLLTQKCLIIFFFQMVVSRYRCRMVQNKKHIVSECVYEKKIDS